MYVLIICSLINLVEETIIGEGEQSAMPINKWTVASEPLMDVHSGDSHDSAKLLIFVSSLAVQFRYVQYTTKFIFM